MVLGYKLLVEGGLLCLGDDLSGSAAINDSVEADTRLVGDGKGIVTRGSSTIITTSSSTAHIQRLLIDLDAVIIGRLGGPGI